MNIDGHNAMSLQNILEMVHSYRPKHIVCILAVWGQIEYGVQKAQGKIFQSCLLCVGSVLQGEDMKHSRRSKGSEIILDNKEIVLEAVEKE